jgi:hypothetical protein
MRNNFDFTKLNIPETIPHPADLKTFKKVVHFLQGNDPKPSRKCPTFFKEIIPNHYSLDYHFCFIRCNKSDSQRGLNVSIP